MNIPLTHIRRFETWDDDTDLSYDAEESQPTTPSTMRKMQKKPGYRTNRPYTMAKIHPFGTTFPPT